MEFSVWTKVDLIKANMFMIISKDFWDMVETTLVIPSTIELDFKHPFFTEIGGLVVSLYTLYPQVHIIKPMQLK